MRALDFAYWLQGYVEIVRLGNPTNVEWEVITNKLSGVIYTSDGQCDPYDHTLMPGNFVIWLRGYVEITKRAPQVEEWQIIKEHLQLVFTKVPPGTGPEKSKEDLSETIKKLKDIDDFQDPYPWKPVPMPIYPTRPFGPLYCSHEKTEYPEPEYQLPGS